MDSNRWMTGVGSYAGHQTNLPKVIDNLDKQISQENRLANSRLKNLAKKSFVLLTMAGAAVVGAVAGGALGALFIDDMLKEEGEESLFDKIDNMDRRNGAKWR